VYLIHRALTITIVGRYGVVLSVRASSYEHAIVLTLKPSETSTTLAKSATEVKWKGFPRLDGVIVN
jgi:hypothetical protein